MNTKDSSIRPGEGSQQGEGRSAWAIAGSELAALGEGRQWLRVISAVIAIGWCIWQLYTALTFALPHWLQVSIHLALVLAVAFLVFPATKGKRRGRWELTGDIILAVVALIITARVFLNAEFSGEAAAVLSPMDWLFSIAIILIVLEALRRTMGLAIPIVAGVFLAYALLGHLIPGWLGHERLTLEQLLGMIYLTDNGIFGSILAISSTYVYTLVAFGAFLMVVGAGKIFIEVATAGFAQYRGGPAKVAIVASALFGTISGSPPANIACTGSFTIPLMKELGFKPRFAAAVEAVASAGGEIMPPVMAMSAFIMAEILGISYGEVAVAALIPAILWYVSLYFMIDFEAAKMGLAGLSKEQLRQLPPVKSVLSKNWHVLASPVILMFLLVVPRWGPNMSGVSAILVMLGVHLTASLIRERRPRFGVIVDGMLKASRLMAGIGALCAALGIIIALLDVTGLGLKFSSLMVMLAGGKLLPLMLLTMIASLVIGMGMPAVVCYILLAVMAAPAMIQLGVLPIAAHLFVFYFGIISALTPPVCIAVFVASAIAASEPMRTGLTAFRMGIACYLVPYMFVLSPALLLVGSPWQVGSAFVTAVLGVIALAAGVEGYLLTKVGIWLRIVLVLAAGLLMFGTQMRGLLGVALLVFVVAFQAVAIRSRQRVLVDKG